MTSAGYSGTPLPKKLGIKEGARVLVEDAPEGFLPDVPRVSTGPADVIVAFHTERAGVEEAIPRLRAEMEPNAGLWIAWPKKASKVPTDLTFDAVQGVGLAAGLVDNKSAAIDEVFQGLQFVYRLRDR